MVYDIVSRSIGDYYQEKGKYVIPNVRWGDERTYSDVLFEIPPAFMGIPKHDIVSIGSYGCCKTKEDKYYLTHGLQTMLQGYNYGSGYIPWAIKKYGGYSYAGAVEFSELQAKKNGWKSYGDKDYVEHVLRYYPYGNYSYDVINTGPGKLDLPSKRDETRKYFISLWTKKFSWWIRIFLSRRSGYSLPYWRLKF